MSSLSLLNALLAHKAWANEELFEILRQLDPKENAAELHSAIRILNHTFVVDLIFQSVLQGESHAFTQTNTVETPSLADLQASIRTMDAWYTAYVAEQSSESLEEKLNFVFSDGDLGCMSREEILVHINSHGSYHRGMVGRLLVQLRGEAPRDIFTRFLHQHEPERRLQSI